MLSWEERPFEIANLMNPAFCSLVLHTTVAGFQQETKQGMPFALSFLVLPLVLHKPTRGVLPQRKDSSLRDWYKHQAEDFGILFIERTRQLIPYTRESLLFGLQRGILQFDQDGKLTSSPLQSSQGKTQSLWYKKLKSHPIIKQAEFLGRWFGSIGHEATIFKIFGIRP